MTVAVVTFPGSNCDRDCIHVMESVVQASVRQVWHKDADLGDDVSAVILPGGFSWGDYLRAGAMAARSHVLPAVKRFAEAGGPVLGICNGFQVLCEVGLLPGALLKNQSGTFVCKEVDLVATGGGKGLLSKYQPGETVKMTVAHGVGNYFVDDSNLDGLDVAFRYADVDAEGNAVVNGSRDAIAGLLGGPSKNVVGLMPHPERRSEGRLGGEGGLRLMQSLVAAA